MDEHSGDEYYKKVEDNFVFNSHLNTALRRSTSGIHGLRVLDYGSGVNLIPGSLFSFIQRDQSETVLYDPNFSPEYRQKRILEKNTVTNIAPESIFDLVVCHFSLHHIDQIPTDIIKKIIEKNRPSVFSIVEYDYTKASLQNFIDTFTSEQEQLELHNLFRDDAAACFDYHRRHSQEEFRNALIDNGVMIDQEGNGNGRARYKFFMIGKRDK